MMTKKIFIVIGLMATVILVMSCNKPRRNTGRAYMPDMAYSRAHETYAPTDALQQKGVNYSGLPVPGTVARGDAFAYLLPNNDTGYARSAAIRNPLDSSTIDKKEAERLYLVFCGICHGSKLDGKGPLFTSGVYVAAPKDFTATDMKAMTEGTMFHSVTYGKGQMGSYASQLSTEQRWQVISYIRWKQGRAGQTAAKDSTAAKTDTTAVQPK